MAYDESIPDLQEAIRELHGCKGLFVETVHVHEKLGDQTVWEGDVQLFALIARPKAKLAYAWWFANNNGKRQFVAVLHIASADSPVNAVRAYIAVEFQRSQN